LTQEFFARRVVTKQIFRGINPGEGRFRTWLLNSLQNLLRNEYDRQNARKRGAGQPHLSLDFTDAEGRYLTEPADNCTPERVYERSWAMTLLDQTLWRLQNEYDQEGKAALFAELKCFLPGALSGRSYDEIAVRTGKTQSALKMAVSRLRQAYGRILRIEIRRTVSRPEDVPDEVRHLLNALED
jgi:RNA polymerase sigma-70 factor (ECF subfamily)